MDAEEDFQARCSLSIKGQGKEIMLEIGSFKSFSECLTEKCILKVEEACSNQDPCVDPKNWLR